MTTMRKHHPPVAPEGTAAPPPAAVPFPLVVVLPGKVVPKGRPRFTFKGRYPIAYTPAKTRKYEAALRAKIGAAWGNTPPFGGAVHVAVIASIAPPASWSLKKQRRAIDEVRVVAVKPDLDNIVKTALDALNGIVIKDDAQVTDIQATKLYEADDALEIVVVEDSRDAALSK